MRADSAFCGAEVVNAVLGGGADASVTVRLDKRVQASISSIGDDAWITIESTDAVFDETTSRWVSRAEVAEIEYTAVTSKKQTEQVPGRLVVRRISDLSSGAKNGQERLFDTWLFHAFFTTTSVEGADTVVADKTHRGHAIIELVHSDPRGSALAHLPSAKVNANAAWLVLAVIASNLTRAAGTLTGPRSHARRRPRSAASSSRSRPDRVLGTTRHPASTHSVALARRLATTLRSRPWSAADRDDLTTADTGTTKDATERTGSEAGPQPRPHS